MSACLREEFVSELPIRFENLSVYYRAVLLALLRSRDSGLPLTPDGELTGSLLADLEERGIVRLAWSFDGWSSQFDAPVELPEYRHGWQYAWDLYPCSVQVRKHLERVLRREGWAFDDPDGRIFLWSELCQAEVRRFAIYQLDEYGLTPYWVSGARWDEPGLPGLSILRWTHAVSSAVERFTLIPEHVDLCDSRQRKALKAEYLSCRAAALRPEWLCPAEQGFSPLDPPDTELAQVLVDHLLPIGRRYWTVDPNTWADRQSYPRSGFSRSVSQK